MPLRTSSIASSKVKTPGDHTDPPHPHPGNLLDMALNMIYTVIHIC